MDNNKIGYTILGMTVLGLAYVNAKLNYRTEVLKERVENASDILGLIDREIVDHLFEEIVENYDR